MNSPTFFGTKSFLKGLPLTSKTASGFIDQIVWYWIKGNVQRFEKKTSLHEHQGLHVNYLRVHVNFRQLPEENADNRYWGDFCLHPQVILPAEHFTCSHRRYFCRHQFYSVLKSPDITCSVIKQSITRNVMAFPETNIRYFELPLMFLGFALLT